MDFGSDSVTPDEELEDEQSNGQHQKSEHPDNSRVLMRIVRRAMCFIDCSQRVTRSDWSAK